MYPYKMPLRGAIRRAPVWVGEVTKQSLEIASLMLIVRNDKTK